jgi:hypothetical protein
MSNSFVDQLLSGGTDHGELEKIAGPEALNVLEELEKTAAAEGIDLGQFTDDQIVEMIRQTMGEEVGEQVAAAPGGEEGVEKVASAPGNDLPAGVDMEKVAAADYLGRVQAHAMAEELAGIWGQGDDGMDKVASVEDITEDEFNQLAAMNANDILEQLGALEGDTLEQTEGREKVASLSFDEELTDLLGNRTAELLDAAGWDVDAIAAAFDEE